MHEDPMRQFLPQVPVAYIGTKKMKRDPVCGTRTVWNGQFDVKHVDAINADILLGFPKVFIHGDSLDEYKKQFETELKAEVEAEEQKAAEEEAARKAAEEAEKEAAAQIDEGRAEAIQSAILALDPDSNEHFFKSTGKPKLKAIRGLLGDDVEDVTQEEVDAVFSLMEA